jgi:hypothetical protein
VFKAPSDINNSTPSIKKKDESSKVKAEVQNGGSFIVDKIIVKKIIIENFFINFCYNSHKLQLENNKNKEFLEILNLTNLSDLKILFRQFVSDNSIILSDIFTELLEYWREDIKNNQIINSFISSISVLKPFKNIAESFLDIFRLPYYYHINNAGISEGASKGFQVFFTNLSSEAIYLGEKVIAW